MIAALLAVAVALWFKREALMHALEKLAAATGAPAKIDGATTPPPVEAHARNINGELVATGPARDVQLGVSANAAVLFRHVEMYQWLEHCDGAAACRYEVAWSAPVDSHKFRVAKGHENPVAPFNDAVFFAPGLKLGEYAVDPDLLVQQLHTTDFAAHDTGLPPNLAASFGERDGVLYAGGDPAHPTVGEVRISYRIIASGAVTLNAVLRGGKLVAH